MTKSEDSLRSSIVTAMQTMHRLGLNRGTAGNASARFGKGLLISPSGVPTHELKTQSIVFVPSAWQDGDPVHQTQRPSSEWRLHQSLFDARPDIDAIVHCHSRFATVLACSGKPIPAVHYLVGLCGASAVPLAPYARFGTAELAHNTVEALTNSDACLLANHGLITCGSSVENALALAEEMEEQAALYWHTLAIGCGTPLSSQQMQEVLAALDDYRKKPPFTISQTSSDAQ